MLVGEMHPARGTATGVTGICVGLLFGAAALSVEGNHWPVWYLPVVAVIAIATYLLDWRARRLEER